MDKGSAWALLEWHWAGIDVTAMACCHCARKIQHDEVLARTFILKNQYILLLEAFQVAKTLDIPSLHNTILIFHRALKCLFHSTRFVAISHVWKGEVTGLVLAQRIS